LANSARAYEDWVCEAINDIHNLADKFNGSVSQRDAEIKNVRNFARTQERQKIERIREEVNYKYFILYL
jgi:hypothetical protein